MGEGSVFPPNSGLWVTEIQKELPLIESGRYCTFKNSEFNVLVGFSHGWIKMTKCALLYL